MGVAQRLGLAAGLALLVMQPVFAGSSGNEAQTSDQAAAQTAALRARALLQLRQAERQTPYSKLFQAPEVKPQPAEPSPADAPATREPRVVCGMTIIPADPSIDPKIQITLPPSDVRHTIRVFSPPLCK